MSHVRIAENVRLPKEIWLAGKGTSLDKYDWSQAGDCRIGINETAFLVPKCTGAIAVDFNVLKKYRKLPPEMLVYRKSTHVKYQYPNMYIWTKGVEAHNLHATAPIAIQLFNYLGAQIIHFVGFDSYSEQTNKHKARPDFADCIKKISGEGINMNNYRKINLVMSKLIIKLGLTAIWEHEQCK